MALCPLKALTEFLPRRNNPRRPRRPHKWHSIPREVLVPLIKLYSRVNQLTLPKPRQIIRAHVILVRPQKLILARQRRCILFDSRDQIRVYRSLGRSRVPRSMAREHLCKGDLAICGNFAGVAGLVFDGEIGGVLAPVVRDIGETLVSFLDGVAGGVVGFDGFGKDTVN